MTRFLVLFLLIGGYALPLSAQDTPRSDSLIVENESPVIVEKNDSYVPDTILIKSFAARYNPRKAILYAAVLPGLGQVYTKKYWKLPIIYGGMIALGYAIDFYQKGYIKYKAELFTVLDGSSPTFPESASGFTEDQLRNIVNKARRERDFMIIMMGLVYVLQMVDAHVDTHLKEFDLNPQLQVRFEPIFENDIMLGRQTGIAMKIRF